jgi:hypothetical protein
MVIYEVNKEQFFKIFPPETRNISVNGEIIANLGDEVICDHCNGDVFYHKEESYSNAFLLSYEEVAINANDIHDVLCKECALNFMKEHKMTKE